MNKRILELAEEAGAETWSRTPMRAVTGLAFTDENLEKFAGLIVKECSKILRNSAYWSGPNGFVRECTPAEMASSIEEHFGIDND